MRRTVRATTSAARRNSGSADAASASGLQVGEEDQKLVPTLPGDDIHLSDRVPQPRGDGFQELVTGCMAEAVVDQLEVVEIDEEHGYARAFPRGASERDLEVLLKRDPVRQPRQRIMQSDMGQLLRLQELRLGQLPLRDVGNDAADDDATIRRHLGAHPVEHPARAAVVPDEPMLDLCRLALSDPRTRRVVGLAIVWVHRRVVRVLGRDTIGNGADQRLQADELEAVEAPVGVVPHLVEHDRDGIRDPPQQLGVVHRGFEAVGMHQPPQIGKNGSRL